MHLFLTVTATTAAPTTVAPRDCDTDDDCHGDLICGGSKDTSNNCKNDFAYSGSAWMEEADCCTKPGKL